METRGSITLTSRNGIGHAKLVLYPPSGGQRVYEATFPASRFAGLVAGDEDPDRLARRAAYRRLQARMPEAGIVALAQISRQYTDPSPDLQRLTDLNIGEDIGWSWKKLNPIKAVSAASKMVAAAATSSAVRGAIGKIASAAAASNPIAAQALAALKVANNLRKGAGGQPITAQQLPGVAPALAPYAMTESEAARATPRSSGPNKTLLIGGGLALAGIGAVIALRR
jgi:hypothetical protein